MNPGILIGFALIAGVLVLLYSGEGQAAIPPRLPGPTPGNDPGSNIGDPGYGSIFDPYIEVDTLPAGATGLTDEQYARALLDAGYNPVDYGYNMPAGVTSPPPAIVEPPDNFELWGDVDSIGRAPVRDLMDEEANIRAFLAVIRRGEGTAGTDGYRTLYGGKLFDDLSDHPSNLGWPGVKLPDAMCRGAGFAPGCVTTAAGAYQFLSSTWNTVRDRLGLPDFSPASQDLAAVELIRGRGALDDVRQGRFDSAIMKVAREWASMPGSPYGQPVITLATARQVYEQNGGAIA